MINNTGQHSAAMKKLNTQNKHTKLTQTKFTKAASSFDSYDKSNVNVLYFFLLNLTNASNIGYK